MISVVISGAGGQVGRALVRQLPFQEGFSLYTFDRTQLDISDGDKVKGILQTLPQIKYWINCAAYTKVDLAEKESHASSMYNADAPGIIARACREAGIHMVHFSSDYVYHNDLRRPLREEDPLQPQSVYARTKLAGEQAVIESGTSYTLIRTSWVFGPDGHNFVNTMLRLGKQNSTLRIVADQLGAPTYTLDIANAVKQLLQMHAAGDTERIQGVFNFANAGQVTWADFARKIFALAGLTCEVINISTEEFGAPAARPAYSVLDCSKIAELLPWKIPTWEDALTRYLNDFIKGESEA